MTPKTTPPSPNNAPVATVLPAAGPGVRLPPDERFWKKYSPHHEAPISGVTSFFIHSIIIALGLSSAFLLSLLGLGEKAKPLPLDAIVVAGGGGHPKGVGNGPGDGAPPTGPEVAMADNHEETQPSKSEENPPDIKTDIKADPLTIPQVKEGRNISASALAGLGKISANAREDMFKGLASANNEPSTGQVAGHGEGGPGSGGGKGKGTGPGEGDAKGPGTATKVSQRQKRVLRWTMMFGQVNGPEYLERLAFFKAILAVPRPTGGYDLIDLAKRPYKPKLANGDDLSQLRRIFWNDSDPKSAASLGSALALPFQPPYVVTFFPEWVEKELLEKELAYRHKEEDDIQETKFLIQQSGRSYMPVVVDQR